MRDKAELCAAMDAHGGMVYRLALCRLGSRSDAEDVYQDVFLRLFQDETCFTDDAHLRAWLIRVTLNDCRDLRRSAWFRAAHRWRTGLQRRLCPRGIPICGTRSLLCPKNCARPFIYIMLRAMAPKRSRR